MEFFQPFGILHIMSENVADMKFPSFGNLNILYRRTKQQRQ